MKKEERGQMRAIHLKAEYLVNPMGIDEIHPRLTWIAEGGKKQSAYEVRTCRNGKQTGKAVNRKPRPCMRYMVGNLQAVIM